MRLCISAICCLLPLTGCYSVTFSKDQGSGEIASAWHHDGILSLVEFSPPVNPTEMCGGDWASVTTSETILTWLVPVIIPPVAGVWDPQQIEVECK